MKSNFNNKIIEQNQEMPKFDSNLHKKNYLPAYYFTLGTGLQLIEIGNLHSGLGTQCRKYVVASALRPEEITKKIMEYEDRTNVYALTEIEDNKVYVYL